MSSSRPSAALRSSAASSSSSSRAGPHESRGLALPLTRDGRRQESFSAVKDPSAGRPPAPVVGSKAPVKEVRVVKGGPGGGSFLHPRDGAVEAFAGGRLADAPERKKDIKTMAPDGNQAATKKQVTEVKAMGVVKLSYDGRSGGAAGKTELKTAKVGRGVAEGKASLQGKPTVDGKAAAVAATRPSDGKPSGWGKTASAQHQPQQGNAGKTEGLPPHTEEDLLKGLTLQAIWSENVEFTSLISAALRICRLSPAASDGDWHEAHSNFLQLLAMAKARLSRQQSLFQAKYHDLEALLDSQLRIQSSVRERDTAILNAQSGLVRAKKNRRNREEYEALASKIAEQSPVAELHALQKKQLEKKHRAEKKTKLIEGQIAAKYEQAQVVVKAAADLLLPPRVTAVPKKT